MITLCHCFPHSLSSSKPALLILIKSALHTLALLFFFTVTNCNIFKVYYVIFLIYIYTVKCLPDQTTYRIYITSFSYCVYVVRTLEIYSLSKFQVYNTLLLVIVTILYVVGGGLTANACSTLVTLWTTTARPLCPWNFPGKHPGVGCHFFLQGIFPTQGLNLHLLHFRWILYCWDTRDSLYSILCVLVAQSCLTLCDPMDCSL